MADYIDRQAAMEAVCKCTNYFIGNLPTMINKDDACKALSKLPSVDAVEVVRCKDCLMHGVCRFERGLGLDGYCSQAKRREDG